MTNAQDTVIYNIVIAQGEIFQVFPVKGNGYEVDDRRVLHVKVGNKRVATFADWTGVVNASNVANAPQKPEAPAE